jgi:hypothetical protein
VEEAEIEEYLASFDECLVVVGPVSRHRASNVFLAEY